MKRILLLGCGGAAGWNFVRSLKMAEHVEEFHIVGTDLNEYQLKASNVDEKIHLKHSKFFTEELLDIVEKHKIDFVHAQPDVMVKRLSQRRGHLPETCKYFLPDDITLAICQDKWETYRALWNTGVPTPTTARFVDLEDVVVQINQLPQVKGRWWLRAREGAGSRAALPIYNRSEAQHWISWWSHRDLWPTDFIICEYLPGKEYAFQSLWWKGKLVTSAARERMEYIFGHLMPSGQSSSPSVAKTVHSEVVNDIATRAIQAVAKEPHGVFCVDLKENTEEIPCVTEINAGRFFTTSDFFAELECDMPWLYVKLGIYGEEFLSHIAVPQYNAVPKDRYWIRSVDREPFLWAKKDD